MPSMKNFYQKKGSPSQLVRKALLLSVIVSLFASGNTIVAEPYPVRTFFSIQKDRYGKAVIESALVARISTSQETIDTALYDLSSERVADALIAAHRRGVKIRIVTDDSHMDRKAVTAVIDAGIPLVNDNGRYLMHNKFFIFDGHEVWTGSYNVTVNGAYRNNNNALLLDSVEMAEYYTREFEEMFSDRCFGRCSGGFFSSFSQQGFFTAGSIPVEVYFSPDSEIEPVLTREIENAQESVRFMAFSFTSDALAEVLIKVASQGVKVTGIMESRGTGTRYSEYRRLRVSGVTVYRDKNRYAMHHKVFIIDNHTVITGSYNYSKNAEENNDENLIIIRDKNVTEEYIREFNRLKR